MTDWWRENGFEKATPLGMQPQQQVIQHPEPPVPMIKAFGVEMPVSVLSNGVFVALVVLFVVAGLMWAKIRWGRHADKD